MRGIDQTPWAYDAMMAVSEWSGLARWRRWLVGGARGRTLEVGCGTGRNLPLYPPGVRVVGMDPGWQNLARAHRRAPNVPLVCGSAEALPFKDGVFDTVVSGLVFCSVPDPMKGLAEVKRVLVARHGVLRMLEHVRSTRALGARLQELVQPVWTWIAGVPPEPRYRAHRRGCGFRIRKRPARP